MKVDRKEEMLAIFDVEEHKGCAEKSKEEQVTYLEKHLLSEPFSVGAVYGVRDLRHSGTGKIKGKQLMFRLHKEMAGKLYLKSGKSGIYIYYVRRGDVGEWSPGDDDDTIFSEGDASELFRRGSVLAGWRGLIKNERGRGVRVLREHLGPARMELMKGSRFVDEHTAGVNVLVRYVVEGFNQDTDPLEVARALREWGWQVIPLAQWVYRQKGMMSVGATYLPPGIDKEGSTTVYAEEGCMVLNPQGVRDKEAIKKGRIGSAPLEVVSSLTRTTAEAVRRMPATPIFGDITGAVTKVCGGGNGVSLSAPTSPRSKEEQGSKGSMVPPEGATMPLQEPTGQEKGGGMQQEVPTALRLRQVGAEMKASKHIGELQQQVNQQIAEVRREVRTMAEASRNDVRGQLDAANILTRKELKVIRDEHTAGQKKVAQNETSADMRHRDLLALLSQQTELMMATCKPALEAGTLNPGGGPSGAKEAGEQMQRELIMTAKREEGRLKAQKEEEEARIRREEEQRKGREEDKRKYDETKKEEEKRRTDFAKMEEESKQKELRDQAMRKVAAELEHQQIAQEQDANRLRFQQEQQQAVAESQKQQYQQQMQQQQHLQQQQQDLAAQEREQHFQRLGQTQALGWNRPPEVDPNHGTEEGKRSWSEEMGVDSEF
jgi:hypothetical protein